VVFILQAKKQINGVEGLEDGTLPCEAASDDCESLRPNDEHALLLNTRAGMECDISVQMGGLCV
jgi:hypothetical protein